MNMEFPKLSLKEIVIIALCCAVAIIAIFLTVMFIHKSSESMQMPTTVVPLDRVDVAYNTPSSNYTLTYEEFEALQAAGIMQQFETYENYTASGSQSSMEYTTVQITADGINKELYDIADRYFNVWYGEMRVSPILIMAISNVETPGRADHNVTWCSLFPSRIVPIEYLYDFDVTYVVSNDDWFKALSSEVSTRDRGCLQMSPTYGTGNSTVNEQMSGNEKDKLALVDTSKYSGWVSGASSNPGDRFYLPDVCLRMTGALQGQTQYMLNNNYTPKSDIQLIVMLAASHHNSGIWCYKDHSKSIGAWRSGDLVYEWCEKVASQPMVDKLTEIARTTDACFIDTNKAQAICSELGMNDYSKYSTKSAVCTYPIKVLYAYIKLCMLYTE